MKWFLWKWKLFWGNCYRIYNNDKLVGRILVYRKRIYILDNTFNTWYNGYESNGGEGDMKKSEMIDTLADKTGLTKADCERVFNATIDLFEDQLAKGEKVSIIGFGTFKVSERAAREGRNPATGEAMKIPASKSVSFKAGAELKSAVNK